jgi:hypothetical protein
MPAKTFFDYFGGRKMFLALVFVVLATLGFIVGLLIAVDWAVAFEKWIDALKWALLIYLGANAVKAVPDAIARKNGNK